jgi:hypothetical protein
MKTPQCLAASDADLHRFSQPPVPVEKFYLDILLISGKNAS